MFPFRIPPLPLILSYFLLGMLLDAPRASIPTQKWGIFDLGRGGAPLLVRSVSLLDPGHLYGYTLHATRYTCGPVGVSWGPIALGGQ